jgi:glutamate transport system permease protein
MISVNFALSELAVWLEGRMRRSRRAPTPLATDAIEQEGAPGARVQPSTQGTFASGAGGSI